MEIFLNFKPKIILMFQNIRSILLKTFFFFRLLDHPFLSDFLGWIRFRIKIFLTEIRFTGLAFGVLNFLQKPKKTLFLKFKFEGLYYSCKFEKISKLFLT